MFYANIANRKRVALLLILGLGGFVSLLVGLWWNAVLHAHATDLARTENAFNLINPDHLSLANAIVTGVIGLGHFLLVFGVAIALTSLIGAVYAYLRSTGNPGRTVPSSRRALVIGALLMLFATGAAWATNAVSHADNLAAEPSTPSTSSVGHKEEEDDSTASPTADQQ